MMSRTPVGAQGNLANSVTPNTLPHTQLIDIALQHAVAGGPMNTVEDDQRQDISAGEVGQKGSGQEGLKPNQSESIR